MKIRLGKLKRLLKEAFDWREHDRVTKAIRDAGGDLMDPELYDWVAGGNDPAHYSRPGTVNTPAHVDVTFVDGVHCTAAYAEQLLQPLFDDGTIQPYPGADSYAICFGELCAYDGETLLATWSAPVPDCDEDAQKFFASASFAGRWMPA